MRNVSFTSVEMGDDLILSFAVERRDSLAGVESIILLRTPKFECFLEEQKRGVNVSCEWMGLDEGDLLQKIEYAEADALVRIETRSRQYELNVRRIDSSDMKKMHRMLKTMNFDHTLQICGF